MFPKCDNRFQFRADYYFSLSHWVLWWWMTGPIHPIYYQCFHFSSLSRSSGRRHPFFNIPLLEIKNGWKLSRGAQIGTQPTPEEAREPPKKMRRSLGWAVTTSRMKRNTTAECSVLRHNTQWDKTWNEKPEDEKTRSIHNQYIRSSFSWLLPRNVIPRQRGKTKILLQVLIMVSMEGVSRINCSTKN